MGTFIVLVILFLGLGALALVLFRLIVALFHPPLPYCTRLDRSIPLDSAEFSQLLAVVSGSRTYADTRIEVLTGGDNFYRAELEAIRSAKRSIDIEVFIFNEGRVASEFVSALIDRLRAGVRVRLLLDSFGSMHTDPAFFSDLVAAGGKVGWFRPVRWHNWPHLNHRTHRNLILVDGRVGFLGGAGIADFWADGGSEGPEWRDTMFQVQGEALRNLRAVQLENWLTATGELIAEDYPVSSGGGQSTVLVVSGSPAPRATSRHRMVFQTLIAAARDSIYMTTPYFLPDRGARRELIQARRRGVKLQIVVPGVRTDHYAIRNYSRKLYGDLLREGIEIFEYSPSMIHTKAMIVDGVWSMIGSSNFDNRSFSLNHEVNMAVRDPDIAARLMEDFARDRAQSPAITYEQWLKRPASERLLGAVASIGKWQE